MRLRHVHLLRLPLKKLSADSDQAISSKKAGSATGKQLRKRSHEEKLYSSSLRAERCKLMTLSPDQKVLLAALVATSGIVLASRIRSDLASGLAMVVGFSTAQWLAASAHEQLYPEATVLRLERALNGRMRG